MNGLCSRQRHDSSIENLLPGVTVADRLKYRLMPSRLRLSVLLLLFSLPSLVHSQDFTGQVVGITDGDSIHVMHNGRAEKVRLHGIDCPEKGQPFGRRAKQATSDLAFGQKVTIHNTGKDKYGRTVATVVLPSGKNLNHDLVKDGWCM